MITFYRACPDAVAPMQADKSALGTLPLQAFQYCEAMRLASALGWYVFAPRAACLELAGNEVLIKDEAGTRRLRSEFLGSDFSAHWDNLVPGHLRGQEIAWLSSLPTPRIIQVWSGFFISTEPGWQVWIKPLTNIPGLSAMSGYEGLVRTDQFKPAPLFANFEITQTGRDIELVPDYPLFQVVAVPVDLEAAQTAEVVDIAQAPSAFDWNGYEGTSRSVREEHQIGRYGATIRRASKQAEGDET